MGKLINGINGSFSGKAGNVVGSSWMGKSYVKSIRQRPPELRQGRQVKTKRPTGKICFGYQVPESENRTASTRTVC